MAQTKFIALNFFRNLVDRKKHFSFCETRDRFIKCSFFNFIVSNIFGTFSSIFLIENDFLAIFAFVTISIFFKHQHCSLKYFSFLYHFSENWHIVFQTFIFFCHSIQCIPYIFFFKDLNIFFFSLHFSSFNNYFTAVK